MIAHATPSESTLSPDALHKRFLTIAPRIELHGRIFFRNVKCPHKRADFIADMIALSWKWFLQLAQRGKDASHFPTALACYAARAVKSGRRVHGMEHTRDVLSPLAQQRRHFLVSTLPDFQTLSTNPFAEALTDNTQSPVPDQVAFRCDFPAWLTSLDARNRQVAQDMALGHKTQDLAETYGIGAGRISQLRCQFCTDWQRFTDELPPTAAASHAGVA